MSNKVWNTHSSDQTSQINSNNTLVKQKHSIQFGNPQGSINHPSEVTSASSGFSAGMKRDMVLIEKSSLPVKKMCCCS